MNNLLLIVDPQNDFIYGSLAVKDADIAIIMLEYYLKEKKFTNLSDIIVTCDFHPYNHCSFKEMGGQWPVHCIKHSEGAALPITLSKELQRCNYPVTFFTKGSYEKVDNYSFVEALKQQTEITRSNQVLEMLFETYDTVYVTGIAGDYCVLETIKDLSIINDRLVVVKNCIASIDGGEALVKYCTENNIKMIDNL